MFATGSLFVAKIALPHEQSLAGGIFNTVNQLGTAFGLAIASVVSDTVHRRALRESGDELGSLLRGYRAAFWTCFGFGTVASRSGHHARLYTRFGSQGVNLWNLHSQLIGNKVQAGGDQESQQFLLSDASGGKDKLLKAQYFKQPLDHFDKSVNSTFGQR
ncbi:hypothetical protein RhiTH_005018 [Rhizoctonia solani]